LPKAAVRVRVEPSGDNGYLKFSRELENAPAHATVYGWWTIKEPTSAVIAYERDLGPATGNVLGGRELEVTMTALPHGETGILAQAESN